MSKFSRCALVAAVTLLQPGLASAAATFTDRAAFLAATGPVSTQAFNAFSSDTSFQNTPLTIGDFTIVGTGTNQLNRNFIDTPSFMFSTHGTGDGTPFADILVAANGGSEVTLTFASAIRSWGADFGDLSQGNVQRATVSFGDATFTPTSTNQTAVRFFGYVSDTPFTTVTFRSTGTNDGFGIDNVSYGFAPTTPIDPGTPGVPEPAAWAMLICGFGAVGGSLRRRSGLGLGRA